MRFLDLKETSTDMAADWIFEKIQVNLVNFISCTFGTASKIGPTFGCLSEKKIEIFI